MNIFQGCIWVTFYLADPTADHAHDVQDMFMIISAISSLIALFETCGFFFLEW